MFFFILKKKHYCSLYKSMPKKIESEQLMPERKGRLHTWLAAQNASKTLLPMG